MKQARIQVTENLRGVVTHLAMLRELHNALYPDTPIYHSDIAAYIGLKSKSTLVNYESGLSIPRVAILAKWLEYWGEGLFVGPLEGK